MYILLKKNVSCCLPTNLYMIIESDDFNLSIVNFPY